MLSQHENVKTIMPLLSKCYLHSNVIIVSLNTLFWWVLEFERCCLWVKYPPWVQDLPCSQFPFNLYMSFIPSNFCTCCDFLTFRIITDQMTMGKIIQPSLLSIKGAVINSNQKCFQYTSHHPLAIRLVCVLKKIRCSYTFLSFVNGKQKSGLAWATQHFSNQLQGAFTLMHRTGERGGREMGVSWIWGRASERALKGRRRVFVLLLSSNIKNLSPESMTLL